MERGVHSQPAFPGSPSIHLPAPCPPQGPAVLSECVRDRQGVLSPRNRPRADGGGGHGPRRWEEPRGKASRGKRGSAAGGGRGRRLRAGSEQVLLRLGTLSLQGDFRAVATGAGTAHRAQPMGTPPACLLLLFLSQLPTCRDLRRACTSLLKPVTWPSPFSRVPEPHCPPRQGPPRSFSLEEEVGVGLRKGRETP